MEPLKVGTVVNLISGSPDMTVTEVTPGTPAPANVPGSAPTPESVTCMWFCGGDSSKDEYYGEAAFHPHSAKFPPAALEVVSTPEERAEKAGKKKAAEHKA